MLANRQNRVHWIILGADSWMDFADGPVRQERFTTSSLAATSAAPASAPALPPPGLRDMP